MIDKYSIAANIELAGLDGYTGTLTAKQQKEVFGAFLFGRKNLKIDATNQGTVKVRFSVSFGQDKQVDTYSFDEIAKAANTTKHARLIA